MDYDPVAALATIDAKMVPILACLALALGFSFVYFLIGVRMAIRDRIYVEPFLGVALFFWHDLSFVLYYFFFTTFDHWWVTAWGLGLMGTVALEAFLIYQFIIYGRRELAPEMSVQTFTWVTLGGVITMGGLWFLLKMSLDDPLFFITFGITAIISTPLHTAIMMRRRSSAGQSVAMQISVTIIHCAMSGALFQIDPVFRTAPYMAFFLTFLVWPFANIWLIKRLPATPQYPELAPVALARA